MILKNYHQTIKIPIDPLDHWCSSEAEAKDIEREMVGIAIDLFTDTFPNNPEPKIFLVGFRKTRKNRINGGRCGTGRFHRNWKTLNKYHNKIEIKIGIKVT